MNLNKTDLVNAVAMKTGAKKKDVDMILSATLDAIGEALSAGEKVQLTGFGSFEVRHRAERMGRNPRTREEMLIPASKVPAFKAGKLLKDRVADN
jgi:DNA-binding protein HU-beta